MIIYGLPAAGEGNFSMHTRKSIVFTCKKVDHPKVSKVRRPPITLVSNRKNPALLNVITLIHPILGHSSSQGFLQLNLRGFNNDLPFYYTNSEGKEKQQMCVST